MPLSLLRQHILISSRLRPPRPPPQKRNSNSASTQKIPIPLTTMGTTPPVEQTPSLRAKIPSPLLKTRDSANTIRAQLPSRKHSSIITCPNHMPANRLRCRSGLPLRTVDPLSMPANLPSNTYGPARAAPPELGENNQSSTITPSPSASWTSREQYL